MRCVREFEIHKHIFGLVLLCLIQYGHWGLKVSNDFQRSHRKEGCTY